MTAALIILAALVVVGLALYIHDRMTAPGAASATETTAESTQTTDTEDCCGMHITCERDSLLASVSPEIEYYDDEELDSYRGRGAEDYAEGEIEQFRDVLLTLLPTDIAGWGRSLQLRGINLPAAVREELLMIVAEERSRKTVR